MQSFWFVYVDIVKIVVTWWWDYSASMLEEPIGGLRNQIQWWLSKGRLNNWVILNEGANWGCLTVAASLWLPHCGYLSEAASLRLVDSCCLIKAASLWMSHSINLTQQLTEAASQWLPSCSCIGEAMLLQLLTEAALLWPLIPISVQAMYVLSHWLCNLFHYDTSVLRSADSIYLAFCDCLKQSTLRSYKDTLRLSNQRCLSFIACFICI